MSKLPQLLHCRGGLLGEDGVLVCQFLNADHLRLGVGAVDMVAE